MNSLVEELLARVPAGWASSDVLQGRHLLLVEESPDQQRLFAMLLENAGCHVTFEYSGAAVVERLLINQEHYDCVLMEIDLPIMDGVEVTRMLRDSGVETPLLALTANGCPETRTEWLAAGGCRLLDKPVTKKDLLEAVTELISDYAGI